MSVIALLTDFGTADFYVGAMKGVILTIKPNALIVDITHEIEPQNIVSASFTLRACYRNFPSGTIFAAVVDPGVGSQRRAILVETENYYFVAPDNGLLSFLFNNADEVINVCEISEKSFFNQPVSRTFHGRDIFAPVAARLANNISPPAFGRAIDDFIRLPEILPNRINDCLIEAQIIHADRFGNLITNLHLTDLEKEFVIEINGQTVEKKYSYFAEALPGEIFMIEGSSGFLEIATRDNSALKLLKISNNRKIYVKNKL